LCVIGVAACLEGERESVPAPEGLDTLALPDEADFELCEALAERQAECGIAPASVDACASRYACARQLWREEIVDAVYDCIAERPCNDVDPANSCLHTVAMDRSDAERRFEASERELEQDCGTLIEVPPGQSDEMYTLLTACIESNDSCDAVSACVMDSLEALGQELCRSTESPSRRTL
jgi:hypothetical protein